jgi:outer membrane lipoprotein-sorting protein
MPARSKPGEAKMAHPFRGADVRSTAVRRTALAAVAVVALAAGGLTTVLAPLPAAAQTTATQATAEATPETSGEALARINDYFNGIRTMSGEFIQFGPTGGRAEGSFVISRPGKVRFDYSPPARIDIVADGKSVVVRDRKRATQDVWPLSQTPLRFLLADKIDLLKDANVTDVRTEGNTTIVVIQEATVFGEGKLTLFFDSTTSELSQWIVTDAQGLDTTVAIYNVQTGVKADPKLFAIDYQRVIGAER